MRYRKLDENGDYVSGHGSADFWHDQPEAVGQSAYTRLMLFQGEWFLDLEEGTPWGGFPINQDVVRRGRILGAHTQLARDVAIKTRVLGTEGLLNIADYDSQFDPNTRRFPVQMTIDTIYGEIALDGALPPSQPSLPVQTYSEWDSGASIWDGGQSRWDRRITP
jgi:hypothetical protein